MPPLNPYFVLRPDGRCAGVWSDAILAELDRARPAARFDELAESFGEVAYAKDGRLTFNPDFASAASPRASGSGSGGFAGGGSGGSGGGGGGFGGGAVARSLKLANYALLSGGVSITAA